MARKYSVLMVCTGNICRSPTAEGVLRHRLQHAGLADRARQVQPADFDRFDLILAMDNGHMELLEDDCPPQHRHKLRRMMEFAPPGVAEEVADPYYGGKQGFETVLDHIEAACEGVLKHIRSELQLPAKP